jgi:hypothetical protein
LAGRKGGFPHSEICGSKGARASPQLIAACHVLHRLSVPRHPSEALMRLIVLSKTHARGRSRPGKPREAILRPAPGFVSNCQTMFFIKSALKALEKPDKPFIHNVIPADLGSVGNLFRCDRAQCPDVRGSSWCAWWSQTGSNRRPHACKARALPTELWPLSASAQAREPVIKIRSPGLSRRVSHKDMWWAQADSNCRPHAYQACALTN